ncbi:MAG: redox-regulated ATPase YchF [Candidatus Cloacimonetes bacterium 4572_65]|nr:MAG: redox-regulated ATPase YchF [Candidatus Cloacimonetes bacterium 4572_65]
MKIGLIGLPKTGKTTIFNALTGMEIEVSAYSLGDTEPNQSVINVMDERITKLSAMYNPKKTVYATIEYVDFAGVTKSNKKQELMSGQGMVLLKSSDALALVVRNFSDSVLDEMHGAVDPFGDVDTIETEMIISDLLIAEKRLEKIELSYKRGIKTPALQIEEKAIYAIISHLNEEKPIRTLELPEEEEKAIRGFQFVSQKPLLVILNSDENNYNENSELLASLREKYPTLEFAGKFEMELNGLDDEEREEFMQDMGITTSARDALTKFSYDILGYISFFTVGTDEVRAWTIINGDNSVEAAGKIHSDLARGFIRAECFGYDDLMKFGSEKTVKDKGLFRLEGKTYIVQDGDILNIRFNV